MFPYVTQKNMGIVGFHWSRNHYALNSLLERRPQCVHDCFMKTIQSLPVRPYSAKCEGNMGFDHVAEDPPQDSPAFLQTYQNGD
jgi:hypothetical protein